MTSTTTTIRKQYGNRKVFTFPEDYHLRSPKQRSVNTASSSILSSSGSSTFCSIGPNKKNEDVAKLIKYIDDNVVGKNNAFLGPFGRRKVIFCDYAASGRSLQFIEEYITREVLPSYGNTHSTTSITSLQSTNYRQEARDLIKNAVNASETDAVIFTGHGCMDALHKLISALDLREAPIVFTGSSEHHDNLQLWQEIGAKLVRIGETKEGLLDLDDLERQLRFNQNYGRQMIGCFSVASNVTGIVVDDIACTMLLHQFGALAFWDYNIGAPCTTIDMNPIVPGVEENSAYKDAIYFSGHKFVGGVQTPGILISKRSVFRRLNSCVTDGFFTSQEYNKSFEMQEEGSCAPVVESIRAGLVMQLKETVTVTNILQRQEKINKQMLQHIRTIPEIILLGNTSPHLKRVPVFSFMVRHPRGTFLHHNFVCAVLNDVFGIQARSGCPCSGSYAQDLLGIDSTLADQYENIILEDRRLSSLNLGVNSTLELLRPGFTRISLPYFISDSELAFVMEAVKMVATEGWKLLPQYVVELGTGEWRHHTNAISKDKKMLSCVRYVDGKMTMNERRISGPGLFPQSYQECLQTARNLFNRSRKTANRSPLAGGGITFDSRGEKLRWFMLQHEAQSILTGNAQSIKQKVPFDPVTYTGSRRSDSEQLAPSGSSPSRHYSFPSIDDPKVLTCSSPVPYFLQDVNGLYYPHFAVGESVSSANLSHLNLARDRCFSLGAPNVSPPVLSPQTRVSLGMRQRNFSYNSQTDLHSLESDHSLNNTHPALSNSSQDCSQLGRGASPAPDIQTYVTEMTRELATNIKSEIREVISRVEDVLENTDSIDFSTCCHRHHGSNGGSGSEDGRSDSISANDVAEYIGKMSIEMANEVKSEIRDMVSAVDVFITPDQKNYYTHTPGSSSDTVINMIKDCKNSDDDEEVDDTSREATTTANPSNNTNKNKLVTSSTVASVSSQDSGINLSFQDQEFLSHDHNQTKAGRSNSESTRTNKSDVKFSTLQLQHLRQEPSDHHHYHHYNRTASDGVTLDSDKTNWICAPRSIWQPSVEALQEFEMIRDGDKVMVALSGGKNSLSLLHTLLQYQTYVQNKGVVFSLGAVTVDPDSSKCDPRSLTLHLKSLGVHYVVDKKKDDLEMQLARSATRENLCSFCTVEIRRRLYLSAKSSGYNVVAVGQHFDDLCESFLMSVFHKGKLKAMKAHYYIKEHNLRVVRPFIYVRDKSIRQFVNNENLPTCLNTSSVPDLSKEKQRIKQVLTQQEILFPKLFTSMRAALHPLIGFQMKECEMKLYNNRKRLRSGQTDDGSDNNSEYNETEEEPV